MSVFTNPHQYAHSSMPLPANQPCGSMDGGLIGLYRGSSPWAEDAPHHPGRPVLVVNTASNIDWRMNRPQAAETWIYFEGRVSWKAAYRLARRLARAGGRLVIRYGDFDDIGTGIHLDVLTFGRHSVAVQPVLTVGHRSVPRRTHVPSRMAR